MLYVSDDDAPQGKKSQWIGLIWKFTSVARCRRFGMIMRQKFNFRYISLMLAAEGGSGDDGADDAINKARVSNKCEKVNTFNSSSVAVYTYRYTDKMAEYMSISVKHPLSSIHYHLWHKNDDIKKEKKKKKNARRNRNNQNYTHQKCMENYLHWEKFISRARWTLFKKVQEAKFFRAFFFNWFFFSYFPLLYAIH